MEKTKRQKEGDEFRKIQERKRRSRKKAKKMKMYSIHFGTHKHSF
jgi:hypothetical protein